MRRLEWLSGCPGEDRGGIFSKKKKDRGGKRTHAEIVMAMADAARPEVGKQKKPAARSPLCVRTRPSQASWIIEMRSAVVASINDKKGVLATVTWGSCHPVPSQPPPPQQRNPRHDARAWPPPPPAAAEACRRRLSSAAGRWFARHPLAGARAHGGALVLVSLPHRRAHGGFCSARVLA